MIHKKLIIKIPTLFSTIFSNINKLISPSPLIDLFSTIEMFAGQRLEPDSRSSDCSRGIQAAISDPAFMLSRQYALGEFEGEDAASVAYAKVSFNYDNIKKIIIGETEVEYNPDIPIEIYIEKTPLEVATIEESGKRDLQLDFQIRMKIGVQFTRELEKKQDEIQDIPEFIKFLAGENGYFFELNEHQKKFEPELTHNFLSIIKFRIIDIYQLFNLNDNLLESELNNKIVECFGNSRNELLNIIIEIINDLKLSWIDSSNENCLFEIPRESVSAWDSRKLEYNFKVVFGDNENKLICDVDGYREDHLNWTCFTVEEETEGYKLPNDNLGDRVVIPKHLRFGGQPEKRFYNFEDSFVNFGALHPKTTDITSLLLMEFAFIHSADWYDFPLTMKLGTIGRIEKLIIKDTFGDEKLIIHAGDSEDELDILTNDPEWDLWNAFTLSRKFLNGGSRNTRYIFLPPVITDLTIGPSHEEIKFLRDETANIAWAVEKVYRTIFGDPIFGYDHYRYRRNIVEQSATPSTNTQPSNTNLAGYTFITSIPWNWIPFIPVRGAEIANQDYPDYKQIVLQRGAMINQLTGQPILPNSRLLNEVLSPYFVDESIIPRSGIFYSERFQKTVWHNGKTFLWIGRKKTIGTGEGYSGLKFDTIHL